MGNVSSKQKILMEGMRLLQRRGLNGFSFQDIANHVGMSKPSLYDHFASKEDLILAIIEEYRKQFDQWAIAQRDNSALQQILATFIIFEKFAMDDRRICPVLALGTDLETTTPKILKAMNNFITYWLTWLEGRIKQGQSCSEIKKELSPKQTASLIYSQLMGAQFQTRIRNDLSHIKEARNFIKGYLR